MNLNHNTDWYTHAMSPYVGDDWLTPCEIHLPHIDKFLQIRETLTRIGIGNRSTRSLTQTCHLLHKQGRYYVMHFKEMMALDGKLHSIDETDLRRRNDIAARLESWGLCKRLNPDNRIPPTDQLLVIRAADKPLWTLSAKYTVGGGQAKLHPPD